MKVAVLTLSLHTNYGGILQAFALQTVLSRFGVEPVLLDKKKDFSLPYWKRPFAYLKRIIKYYIFRDKRVSLFVEQENEKQYKLISQYTQRFIDHNLKVQYISSFNDKIIDNFDCFIVGSDQVWRPQYFKASYGDISYAFLSFIKKDKIRKIAYAASFGTEEWEYSLKETEICKKLISKFDKVSVRESSAVLLCDKKFNKHAELVLDPTLLLSKEDYKNLIFNEELKIHSEKIFVYILDSEDAKMEFVNMVSSKLGMEFFTSNSDVDNISLTLEKRIQPPIENWLMSFDISKMVITDSFHACVFSIIFNKPFWVIGNKKRGMTRFISLLELFDLKERLIQEDEIGNIDINAPIDWVFVNNNLKLYREKSYNFLKTSFS